MSGTCIVIGAGEYFGEKIAVHDGDCVIAADAGYLLAQRLGIRIDEVIGDFDSTGFVPDFPRVRRLPVEKDDTDTLHALRVGVDMGFDTFHIHGGTGGRLDHTIANIQCLTWLASLGRRGFLYDHGSVFTVIANGVLELPARDQGIVSVFAVNGEAKGVTIKGLQYETDGVTLTGTFPIGCSNAFVGRAACIGVEDGYLLVSFPNPDAAEQA